MIFLGCLYNKLEEVNILKISKNSLSNAANTFQWNLIEGFKTNRQNFTIINVLTVGTFPKYCKKIVLKTKKWTTDLIRCTEIGCINLPFIKQYQRYKRCKKIIKQSNDKNILIYSTYEPFLRAVHKLPKEYKISLIVTDLPEYYDLKTTSLIRKIARKLNNKKIDKYLQRIDNYILLTEQMRHRLPINNKPHIVIEGICSEHYEVRQPQTKQNNKKIIFYAGSYRLIYGIKNLLDAFTNIKDKQIELWLCGQGEATPLIKECSNKDPRIKDFGYCTHDQILALEQQATILINPRQNTEEYTKYSFPSKTMEYLASGTPVLMHKLDGIPDEYDNYLYYINGNSIKDLKKAIEEALSKPEKELKEFGQTAQEWVLKNKNATKQTEKIMHLINNNNE